MLVLYHCSPRRQEHVKLYLRRLLGMMLRNAWAVMDAVNRVLYLSLHVSRRLQTRLLEREQVVALGSRATPNDVK